MILIKYEPEVREDGPGRIGRNLEEPSDELKHAFEQYLNEAEFKSLKAPENFDRAYSILFDHKVNYRGVNSLFTVFDLDMPDDHKKHDFKRTIDCFLTAAYNLTDENPIIYQVETDYDLDVGYGLNPDKTLFLESDTSTSGTFSEGTIINLAQAENLGNFNQGLCINANTVSEDLAMDNEGVVVNLGQAFDLGFLSSHGLFINFGAVGFLDLCSDFDGNVLSTYEIEDKQIRITPKGSARYYKFTRGMRNFFAKILPENLYEEVTRKFLFNPEDLEQNEPLNQYLDSLEQKLEESIQEREKIFTESETDSDQTLISEIKDILGGSHGIQT